MPFLVELRNQTQGTVAVAVLVDTDAVYLDRIDGNDVGGVYRDGRRVHQALSCAAGRVLAANAPDDVWKKVIANHDDRWSSEDRDHWCQADYVLVEDVEATGHVEIAAPVRDSDGDVRAAVTVTGNPAVFTPEHLETHVARHLLRTVKAIPWGAGRG
jgi:DNA-binding IclR family transcriptional regulator